MSATAEQTRPYNKTETLAPKLSPQDLNNLLTVLPKLSEKEQVALLKELTDFEELLITSEVNVTNDQTIDNDVESIASKAEGKKCPVCWKISENECERHSNI